jgi:hypothetical protein
MHEAYELIGNDEKKHFIWARTDERAISDGRKWGYKHGGLLEVCRIVLNDEEEGCWNRATRIPLILPAYA